MYKKSYIKSKFLLLSLALLSSNSNISFGKILDTPRYHFYVSNKREKTEDTLEGGTYNRIGFAAHEGENNVTIKNVNIEAKIPMTSVSSGRYHLSSSSGAHSSGLIFADNSFTGKNTVNLENVNIITESTRNGIFQNDQDPQGGQAETTINMKGIININTIGNKVAFKSELNGIQILKNTSKGSKTIITSDKDSTLNITLNSGPSKGRGIGVTMNKGFIYNNAKPNVVTMNFYGDVNIKINRDGNSNAEQYGVYTGIQPTKNSYSGSKEAPDGTSNTVTFHKNLSINVEALDNVDENGKILPKSIGDAINVDGKGSKVIVKGRDENNLYDVKIKGDVHSLNGGEIELNLLTKDSYLDGEAHISKLKYSNQNLFNENRDDPNDEDKNTTKLDLKMANGSNWNVKNNSKVSVLDISGGSKITFSNEKNHVNVSVGKLKGDKGILKIQGNISKNDDGTFKWETDTLTTRKSSEGEHIIEYEDYAGAKTTGKEFVKIIENKGDEKDNKAVYKLKQIYSEQGAYLFKIGESEDSKVVNIEPDNKNDFYLHPTGDLTPGAQGSLILSDMMYQLNLASRENLVQRLGEIHHDKHLSKFNNVWAKNVDGKYLITGSSKSGNYSNIYWGLKVSWDWVNKIGNWLNYKGLELGAINSNGKLLEHSSKINLYGKEIGVYSTWLGTDSDIYFDFVLKFRNYKGNYNLINFSNVEVKSSKINLMSYTVNVEAGKRIYLARNTKRDLYLQLEGQGTYTYTDGYSLKMSNGLDIKSEPLNSLIGRAGFRLGVDNLSDDSLNPYFKFMYEREFLGRSKYIFNETGIENISRQAGWITYGLGLTNVNKKKGRQLYFELQRTSFNPIRQTWQVNLGLRRSF